MLRVDVIENRYRLIRSMRRLRNVRSEVAQFFWLASLKIFTMVHRSPSPARRQRGKKRGTAARQAGAASGDTGTSTTAETETTQQVSIHEYSSVTSSITTLTAGVGATLAPQKPAASPAASSLVVAKNRALSALSTVHAGFSSAFLPQGYPASVSSDYLSYQVWDTVQAFCSYVTGTLSHTAVLQGIGVGNAAATASGATVTYLTRDGAGMLGSIVFAWLQGTDLDNNAQQWRLIADLLNDVALFVELIAPAFPAYFVWLVCFASLAKAVVGVAGGATRAALTHHQARCNNMGDVSAKDGSQERLVNLAGLFVGYAVTTAMEGAGAGSSSSDDGGGSEGGGDGIGGGAGAGSDVLNAAGAANADDGSKFFWTWTLFCCFTVLHLYANYKAVRALELDQLNGRRAAIVMGRFIKGAAVPTPRVVAGLEPLLFTTSTTNTLQIKLGVSVQTLAPSPTKEEIVLAASACHGDGLDAHGDSKKRNGAQGKMMVFVRGTQVSAVLHKSADVVDVLKAQFFSHALEWHGGWCAERAAAQGGVGLAAPMQLASDYTTANFGRFVAHAKHAGWVLDRTQLGIEPYRSEWSGTGATVH